MINLDSLLKSRDITLPKKVCLVKAMIFPVDVYGCESYTIKKAEFIGQRGRNGQILRKVQLSKTRPGK